MSTKAIKSAQSLKILLTTTKPSPKPAPTSAVPIASKAPPPSPPQSPPPSSPLDAIHHTCVADACVAIDRETAVEYIEKFCDPSRTEASHVNQKEPTSSRVYNFVDETAKGRKDGKLVIAIDIDIRDPRCKDAVHRVGSGLAGGSNIDQECTKYLKSAMDNCEFFIVLYFKWFKYANVF
jgi:hypothetical protein